VLNEELADERANVRMVEDIVERVVQILQRAESARLGLTVEQLLGPHVVLGGECHHWPGGIDVIVPVDRA
jgi:hypothetical protein